MQRSAVVAPDKILEEHACQCLNMGGTLCCPPHRQRQQVQQGA